MKELTNTIGIHISEACRRLVAAAPAWMEFNGIRVEARGGETASDLEASWSREMNARADEAERKRRAFDATPEGQHRIADARRARDEEERLQREAAAAIDSSGVRARYPWPDGGREISGFGGGYEAACRTMMYAALLWLEQHPNANVSGADRKAFEAAVLRAEPGCSGAMFGAAINHARFIHINGHAMWASRLGADDAR